MTDAEDNPLLITLPPGVSIPTRAAKTDVPEPRDGQADETPESFITLPPGVIDSGTFRVAHPRVVPTRATKSRDDIVFFPVQPGIPSPTRMAPGVEDDPGATQKVGDATAKWQLVLPEGAGTHAVERALFLGRNPAAAIEWPHAELIALVDTAKTLSKTHALLEVDGGQLWVHDLDSTNGVFIVPAEGEVIEVISGTRAHVPAGADLELGEYVIRVEYR